jgi:hypothetical protein
MMRRRRALSKPPANGRAPTATGAELLPEQLPRPAPARPAGYVNPKERARQKIAVLRSVDGRLMPPAVRGELSERLFRKLLQFRRNVPLHSLVLILTM